MRNLLLILCVLLLGCTTVNTPSLQPESVALTTKVDIAIPMVVVEVNDWLTKSLAGYCKQLEIPEPPLIVLHTFGIQATSKGHLIRGRYFTDTKLIEVWVINFGLAEPRPLDDIKHTILHELLHFHDDIKGLPQAPEDHNEIFAKRLKDLGWIK